MREMLTGGLVGAATAVLVVAAVLVGAVTATVRARRQVARGTAVRTATYDAVVLVGIVGAVASILALTVLPRPGEIGPWAPADNLVPFASIRRVATTSVHPLVALRILAGNIALFVPLGFFVALRRRATRPLRDAVVVAAGLSVAVESAQWLLPGRTTNVDDVILNVAGGLAGALAAIGLLAFGRRPDLRV